MPYAISAACELNTITNIVCTCKWSKSIDPLLQVNEWVSRFLNGTSAQLGYTVPFTMIHAGKYRTDDKSKTDSTKTRDNPEKANTKHSKTKLVWFSRFLRHSARKRCGLTLQGFRAHTGLSCRCCNSLKHSEWKCPYETLDLCVRLKPQFSQLEQLSDSSSSGYAVSAAVR